MEKMERKGSYAFHLRPQMQLFLTAGEAHKRANKRKSKRGISWKKRRIDDNSERRPWADLPVELLGIISKELNIADYLTFGRVCKSWRSCYSESKQKFMSSQSPLVVFISSRAKRACYFYDITSQIGYKTKLPYLASNFCLGISNGHLIMVNLDSNNVWVVNPVTGHQLEFPNLPQPGNTMYCCDRAIFGSINGSEQEFMVVILSPMHRNLRYCMSTTNEWRDFSYSEKPWYILDIIIFCGCIFVLTSNNRLAIFDLKSPRLMFLNNLESTPRLSPYARFVATNGRLVIVDFIALYKIGIYSIDFSRKQWTRVPNLGHYSLFIGEMMSSRIINATNWGGPSNCVFYLPFMSNTCFVYTITGQILGTLRAARGKATPRINCWYFPHQAYSIDKIKVDKST